MNQYPGAVFSVSRDGGAFSPFEILLHITGGVTLSQVCEMTGLEPSTVQNWVKRGWVPKPIGKRYGEQHLARVFLINSLRGVLQLENIIDLLHHVNGNLNDPVDDIISDRALYDLFCRVLYLCENGISMEEAVDEALNTYIEPYDGAKSKLRQALAVMLPAYRSAQLKRKAETALRTIKGGNLSWQKR